MQRHYAAMIIRERMKQARITGMMHGDDVIWLRGYECAAVWFGGGSSEPPHGLYGPKTPIAIPTSHRSVTSLALTEIGWRGT